MSERLQSKRHFVAYLIGVVLLILLTWISADPAFKATLLNSNSMLSDASTSWSIPKSKEGITVYSNKQIAIDNPDKRTKSARIEFPVDTSGVNYLEFTGWLENLGDSEQSIVMPRQAVLYLAFLNNEKIVSYAFAERLSTHHQQRQFQSLIKVPSLSNKIRIGFYVRNGGHWQLQDAQLIHAKPATSYKIVRNSLAFVWFLLGLTLLLKLLRSTHWLVITPIAITVIFIVAATGASKGLIQAVLVPIWQWSANVFNSELPSIELLLNYGHSFMFALISGILLLFSRRLRLHWVEIVLVSVVLATASEAMQRHSFTRSPGIDDLMLDFIGIGASLTVYCALSVAVRLLRGFKQSTG